MQVRCGDTVKLRDGRTIDVTDAADSNPESYRWYRESADGTPVIAAELPPETILVGTEVIHTSVGPLSVRLRGGTVVSDMSEVVSIIN